MSDPASKAVFLSDVSPGVRATGFVRFFGAAAMNSYFTNS